MYDKYKRAGRAVGSPIDAFVPDLCPLMFIHKGIYRQSVQFTPTSEPVQFTRGSQPFSRLRLFYPLILPIINN